MERQPLSIRKFAEVCGVSHTKIGRKMTALGISGTPQGKGLPTLLSPAEQDSIAQTLFIPEFTARRTRTTRRGSGQWFIGLYAPAAGNSGRQQ